MKFGQIDLFTKRVRKAPRPLERALHIAVADTLKVGIAPGWLWAHYPSGELRQEKTGALLQRMGVKKGWPDLLLVSPDRARLHGLELKRQGEKPTESQLDFMVQLGRAGGVFRWTDNYDEAVEILRSWGALSEKLHI